MTVMLLALSIGKIPSGPLAVARFSLSLAVTLVGIGLLGVAGLSRFQSSSGKLHWISSQAPILSSVVFILSSLAILIFAHSLFSECSRVSVIPIDLHGYRNLFGSLDPRV